MYTDPCSCARALDDLEALQLALVPLVSILYLSHPRPGVGRAYPRVLILVSLLHNRCSSPNTRPVPSTTRFALPFTLSLCVMDLACVLFDAKVFLERVLALRRRPIYLLLSEKARPHTYRRRRHLIHTHVQLVPIMRYVAAIVVSLASLVSRFWDGGSLDGTTCRRHYHRGTY